MQKNTPQWLLDAKKQIENFNELPISQMSQKEFNLRKQLLDRASKGGSIGGHNGGKASGPSNAKKLSEKWASINGKKNVKKMHAKNAEIGIQTRLKFYALLPEIFTVYESRAAAEQLGFTHAFAARILRDRQGCEKIKKGLYKKVPE